MKIYLDIGHGGQDSGAVANGVKEKDLTLKFGLMVRDGFLARKQNVLCSRESDVNNFGNSADDAIIGSAAKANNWGAELFLSLHFNASDNEKASGAQFIYSVFDSEGKALCDKIAKSYIEAGEPLNAIYTRTGSNGLDYYGVIRLTDMQAIIIENAFVTNGADIKKFENDEFCKKIAEALCSSVAEFFGLENNGNEEGEAVYYRVRKTWADASSQIGAYTSLDNAKVKADENPGYYVFNEKGEAVYPISEVPRPVDYEKLYKELKIQYDLLEDEHIELNAKVTQAVNILKS